MNYLLLNGAIAGHKTRHLLEAFREKLEEQLEPSDSLTFIDLKDKKMVFSDGRNWQDNQGDTLEVLQKVMAADVLVFGVPTYQASVPAPLKNIFDLLPEGAFYHKTVGFLVTAGSAKHYLVMEFQLKPILSFMKANSLPNYVFAEDADFKDSTLIGEDVYLRLERYAEDIKVNATAYQEQLKRQEEKYDF